MTTVVRKLSLAVTGIVGLTYAVGYLVSSMYHGVWGIHGSSLNIIRAHYIHIGFLCLTPPIVLSIVIAGGRWIIKRDLKIDGKKLPWTLEGNATLVVLVFGLYLLALLAQRSSILHDEVFQGAMILMTLLSVTGLFGVNWIVPYFVKPEKAESASRFLKYLILVFVAVCLILMGYRLFDTISDIARHQKLPVFLYLALAFLVGLIGTHNIKNIAGVDKSEARPVIAVATLALVAPLMYFMVVSFAFGLYPYVPASRGGADFTEARPVEINTVIPNASSPITFTDATTQVPAIGERLFLIEEAADMLYFGRERMGSTAHDWRHRGNRPDLIVLNRKDIRSIRFLGQLGPQAAP